MAEFKFSCPLCNQHIQCDTGYVGMQINCPSCNQAIIVPATPRSAAAPAAPPPPPPGLATRQSTTVPATGQRFAGAPGAQPPPKPKSKALKTVLVITACIVVLAGLGAGGWFAWTKFKAHQGGQSAKKANPAAQVATPTAAAAVQALSLLTKVQSAYTNITSAKEDGTLTLFLNLSNLTAADLNPDAPVNPRNARNATRRPAGLPRVITNRTEYTVRRANTNWVYFAGEAMTKVDRQSFTTTIAFWSADKGTFMYSDMHQGGTAAASYQQLADAASVSGPTAQATEQIKNLQHLFSDPAQLAKIIKDLGQTDDESVNGHDCYTLTAKVLGQKIKIWVDKSTYLISQSQIIVGGAISDADVDDAVSLFTASGLAKVPPGQLDMITSQIKKYTPAMTKIRGTLTSTSKHIEVNPNLSADDFTYAVPAGVRLVSLNNTRPPANAAANAAVATENRQRNTCINSLRQIDAAKNQWALEKGKKPDDPVTEADLKPYLPGGALPKCPAGGKYTIGKVGEQPTCSIASHVLP